MCVKNLSMILCSLLFLLFCFMPVCVYSQDAQAQERMYLILESELSSIEQYKQNSEKEKQSWLSRVQNLSMRAEKLERDSASLNNQLSQARAQNRKLESSFNEYEKENLILLSSKNGEIEELKQKAANEKIKSQRRLIINIVLAAVIFVYCAIKLYRKLRK